ncbi:MAG: amino acid adenylation domain-containing protein, partial [bacterium]|nr:amino acid adenylation domain-containing protein [bacterium]
ELTAERFAKDSWQLAVGSWQKEKAIKEKKQKTKKEIENEPEKGSQLQLKRTALPNKSLWESGTLATPVLDQLSSERVLAPGGHTCRRPPEAPLYKTGDLARWLPDGNIEFLGRIDHQVKIRGMRVELGEIERGLLTHPEIKEAVVLARELKKGDTVLCAYYVVKSIPPPETALKDYLSHTLPAYMIPTHFIRQEKIPLTPTEKIDRKALAQIHIPKLKSQAYSAPRTETEKKMVEIWADILEYPRDKLGIDDDFFQIRGHSLNATTMTARIHKTFNINIPLAVIFKTTTIRGLAGNIKGLTEDTYLSVKPAEKKEYYILSAPQKRVYILQQMELESTAYNMPVTLPLGGNTGLVELENMFRKLIRRHDSLRTSFGMIKETPVQLIHDTVEFKITHYKRNQTFFRPFDLAQAPLIRVGVRQEEGGAILLLDMHHIITDGISLEILTGELAGLYRNENLTPLKRQYKDYAEWQNNIKQKELMSRQEAIWLKRFSGELPVLELPTDYPRPVNLDFEGSTIPFAITKEETAELKGKAKENESTLYMVILSIFSIMLSKLGGQEDIVIGTATAGRRHADLENIVGMFVNTLAIRIYVDEEKSVTGFLGDVKRNTLEAFENQEYPFEDLVDRLSKRRDAGRNPIFDVMFNLLNQPPQNEQDKNSSNPFNSLNSLNSFNSLNSPNPLSTSKFDLTLSAFDNTERGDALTFQFQYRTKLFKEGTIKRFITYFKKMIQTVPRDPGQKISELELLTEKERKQILYKFNDTATDYPRDKTIHQLFEEQVEKNPDKITTVGSTQYAVGKGKTVGSRQYAVDNENIKDKTKNKKEIKNNKKIKDNKETIEDKELTAREKTSSIQHQASSIPSTPSTPSIQSIQLTYRELNKNSNHLARHLQSKGVEPGALVAIMVERSVEMLTGILAILKAGAAYLPLSPAYPRERIRYLLADSNVGTVLTTRSFSKELNAAGKIIHFDEAAERAEQEVPAIQAPLPVRYPSTGIAYIIYTSGSTGRPKGTLIEHRSLVNLSLWHGRYYEITADDHSTQYADFSFDASVCEIFPYLIKGATLHIIADEMRLDILELKGYYNKNKITLSFLPTQVCQQFMEDQQETPSLRCLLTAGEKLTHFIPRSYGLYNNYGPTENTVAATTIHVKEQSVNIPIGKPVDNSRVYIMDRQFAHLQPIGVPGELCIGGDSLARGYLNKPELTAERFAKDSWQKEKREQKAKEPEKGSPSKLTRTAPLNKSLWESRTLSSERVLALGEPPAACLYRTGDLARWLPDGNIEFLGRIDQQVKIRGFRIELGEIEKCLSGHREINEAVVIARQMEGNDRVLCAYYVLGSTQENHDFKGFLSRYLPDYMIPSFFVELEKIPLTPNGKVDVKALPAPEIDGDGDYEAPEGRVARTLAAVWRQVLNIGETRRLGVNDNFFNLGGDSIKTIQIAARLRKYDLKLDVKDLFLYQTIKQLVPHIKKISRSILQGAVEGKVPLTPVQQWFFRTFVTDRHHFNQSVLIYREKGFDKSILERVFSKIIQHHDALRMVYEIEKKTGTRSDDIAVIQQNRGVKEQLFHLETIDLKNLTEENVKKRIPIEANRIQGGIDLKNGPLVKLGLFKTSSGHHLLIAVHHLVVDGISWRILLEDIQTCFNQAYQGEKLSLPDKTDSFKYWAEKLTQYAQGTYGQSLFKEKEYWEQVERAEVKPLPVDREIRETGRDKRKVKYRENVDMSLDKTETLNLLKKVNWAYNTEINDILLAALALALKEWNQMEKIRLILEGHGRETIIEDVDINRTVGWFTSRYPVLLDLSHVSEKNRHQLAYTVKSVKETLRRIPNKGVNYGILTYLATNRQTAGLLPTPGDAAEITFNYLGQFGGAGDENAPQYFGMSPIGGGENHSPEMEQVSLIDINGMVAGDRLNMTVSYNRNQFDHKNITRLTTLFKSKLQEIIRHTMSRKEKEHTPSDLGTHRITIEKLEELTGNVQHTFGKNTKISHIYPLSPMQQGMLFHQIADKKSSAYFEQTLFSIKGELEVQRFKESFGLLTERYEILRTLFLYESLETPLQMVLETEESAENTVRFLYKDISHIKESEIPTFLEKFRQKDKENGFELSRDMPIRIAVLKTGHQSYHIIWSFFHIIMDGWCIGIIFKELLYFYNSLKEEPGAPIQLEPVTPYRTYICWLEKQDNEEGLEFWQNYLEGYEQVSELPKTITTDGKHKLNREYKTAHLDYELDAPKTAHLNTLAQENGTTLNLV